MTKVRLGLSTCPNDTFAFHALMAGEVDARGLSLEFVLADVEELNEAMLGGELDASKVSFHAALLAADRIRVLPSGSALGFGVGPLVLGRSTPAREPASREPHVLCPGRLTTATLLWKLFHPEPARLEQRVFSEIMPALKRGDADLGVCIHEGRFTWQDEGLAFVEDLGDTWEREAGGAALPLGGIVANESLGAPVLEALQAAVHDSLQWGLAHRERCVTTMRSHAQEQSDDVLWAHVDLYVNRWTVELGEEGGRALRVLSELARERSFVGAATPDLRTL